jgi:hypothetical protein
LVEKWIPPSRSETAKIGQKTEGILGVKDQLCIMQILLLSIFVKYVNSVIIHHNHLYATTK